MNVRGVDSSHVLLGFAWLAGDDEGASPVSAELRPLLAQTDDHRKMTEVLARRPKVISSHADLPTWRRRNTATTATQTHGGCPKTSWQLCSWPKTVCGVSRSHPRAVSLTKPPPVLYRSASELAVDLCFSTLMDHDWPSCLMSTAAARSSRWAPKAAPPGASRLSAPRLWCVPLRGAEEEETSKHFFSQLRLSHL